MRIAFFVVAAMMVGPLFSLARRAASPGLAAVSTLLCVAWSVPNYFTGMPSWYVLFFSLVGIWALFGYFDSHRGWWLVLAGLCGGLAVAVKITGLYFVAAAGVALVYHEQNRSREGNGDGSLRSPVMFILATLLAGGLVGCVFLLLRRMWRPSEIVYFVSPAVAIAATLVSHEWNIARGPAWTRLKHWTRCCGLFGLGVAVPLACFLIPYLLRGGLPELVRGLFVLPEQRFEFAALPMPGLITFVPVIFWAGPLLLTWRFADRPRTPVAAAVRWSLSIIPCAAVLWACRFPLVYDMVWCSMLNAVPVVAIAGCSVVLASQRQPGELSKRSEQLFLLVLAASLLSLQQFPFALAVYFFFGVPLLVLAALHVLAGLSNESRRIGWCLGVFYLAFAVLWVNPAFNVGFSGGYSPDARLMDLPRSGLRVPQSDARQYEAVVRLVQQNSPPGSCILALPDCPEVYFLAARKNPTRRLYDFLTEPYAHGKDVRHLLETQAVSVVVINLKPSHSPPVDPGLLRQIQVRYPERRRVNHFVVFWKPAESTPTRFRQTRSRDHEDD